LPIYFYCLVVAVVSDVAVVVGVAVIHSVPGIWNSINQILFTKFTKAVKVEARGQFQQYFSVRAAFMGADPKNAKRLTIWLYFLRFWDLRA